MATETNSASSQISLSRMLEAKAKWHRAQAKLPLREKVRLLLQLQRQDLPLIARRPPPRSWERPWPIQP